MSRGMGAVLGAVLAFGRHTADILVSARVIPGGRPSGHNILWPTSAYCRKTRESNGMEKIRG